MYKKGKIKTGGRELGTKNKISGDLRERLNDFLSANFEDFVKKYKALPANEQIKTFRLLIQYIMPRMNAINIKQEDQINEIKLVTVHKNHNGEDPRVTGIKYEVPDEPINKN